MAKIHEELIIIKVSKLYKEGQVQAHLLAKKLQLT